jgi:hypothetical protein
VVNIRIDYCSPDSCALDFFEARLLQIDYQYFNNLDALKKKLENSDSFNKVWLTRIERFEKWLKTYDVIADLGYLVFYNKERRVERIVNIHMYYSVWLKRPLLRVSDITEFTVEVEEEEDDP